MFFFHFDLLFPNPFKNKQHLFSSLKSHVGLRLPLHCPWIVLNLFSFQSLLGYLQYYNCQPFKCLTSWTIDIAGRIFKGLVDKINYSCSHVFVHCVLDAEVNVAISEAFTDTPFNKWTSLTCWVNQTLVLKRYKNVCSLLGFYSWKPFKLASNITRKWYFLTPFKFGCMY